jgi:2-keto-4-pentenoate hydratase
MTPELVEATRRQLAHWRAAVDSGAHRVGWKIGFNAPAIQEQLGLEHSIVGHITTATLVGAQGTHSLAGAKNPLAEPEVAIHVGRDHSIAGLAPAIEVIDMDAIPSEPGELLGVIERNIFHRAVAIGSAREGAPAEANFSIDGAVAETADASAVDLPATVELVAEILESAGEELQAGDRIIAGTLTPPQPLKPGGSAALDLGDLGEIGIDFTH